MASGRAKGTVSECCRYIGDLRMRPVPMSDRIAVVEVERGRVEVVDSAMVVTRDAAHVSLPVGKIGCILLGPGTSVTHAAVKLAGEMGTLLLWTGEGGTRIYSAGKSIVSRSRLPHQIAVAADKRKLISAARRMMKMRFGISISRTSTLEQIRGVEGAKTKELYARIAADYGAHWSGRVVMTVDWRELDIANQCVSAANACLYGISEAAILAAGLSPEIGILHSGDARSFVFDIADLFKFDTSVPLAFQVLADSQIPQQDKTSIVRRRCRNLFRETNLIGSIIPKAYSVLGIPEEPDVDAFHLH